MNNENYCYTRKFINIFEFEGTDIIASPWDYNKTEEWYKEQMGYNKEDHVSSCLVDIKNEGFWREWKEAGFNKETIEMLFFNMTGILEIVRNDYSKFHNIRMNNGDIEEYISFEEYCIEYLNSNREMTEPEFVASSEY